MKKILLDTNAFSSLLRGDPIVFNEVSSSHTVYMSVVVLGEVYAGYKGGSREIKNRELLDNFLSRPFVKVLNISYETSDIYGTVFNYLKKSGKMIPQNDIWIAAGATETGSLLITYDRHFQQIPGLKIWNSDLPLS